MKNSELEQIYNLALQIENRGVSIYSQLENDPLFSQIATIRKAGIKLLENSAANFKFNISKDKQNSQVTELPEPYYQKLIVALNYEIELNRFYENATNKEFDEKSKDLFFRLWATSYNEYMKALEDRLKSELNNKATTTNNNESGFINKESYQNAADFLQKASRVATAKASKEEIEALLLDPNFSFFSGLAAGGLVGVAIKELLDEEKNNKE